VKPFEEPCENESQINTENDRTLVVTEQAENGVTPSDARSMRDVGASRA